AAQDRSRSAIAGGRSIRVTTSQGVDQLERVTIGEEGVGYRRIKGWPPPRRALIVGSESKPAKPPNPIPWSMVSRLERPVHRYAGAGTAIGGTLGLVGGAWLGAW